MSRALTIWSRKDAAQDTNTTEVEKIMASQGCSEPVAKNLLKYAKLGIGPLASNMPRSDMDDGPPASSSRGAFPPRLDRKAAAALAEQKLRERQDQEEAAEAARHQPKRRGGIGSLGPVMAREEEVDPLRRSAEQQAAANHQRRLEEQDGGEEKDAMQALFQARPGQAKAAVKKPMSFGGISKLTPVILPASRMTEIETERATSSKKAAHEEDEEDDDLAPPEAQWDSRQFADKKRAQQEEEKRRNAKRKNKRKRGKHEEYEEDEKDEEEEDQSEEADRKRSPSPKKGGSLMSEKEVMALMGKRKLGDERGKRGSVRANLRIQKEQQEWESRKANNPEFWKAPQFALCFSAETGKKARGAG